MALLKHGHELLIELINYSSDKAAFTLDDLVFSTPYGGDGPSNTRVFVTRPNDPTNRGEVNYNRLRHPEPIVMPKVERFIGDDAIAIRFLTLHALFMLWQKYGVGPTDEDSLVFKSADISNPELSVVVFSNNASLLFLGDITVHVPHFTGDKRDISSYNGENADGAVEPWWFEPNSLEKSFGWEVK